MDLATTYADLLAELPESRRAHSVAVGERVASLASRLAPAVRAEVVAAGVLHDVGYSPSWVVLGFHPLDGAAGLRERGFSPLVCDLVSTHTGALWEADERGLDVELFDGFRCDRDDIALLRRVVTWADLTTGPTGQLVTVDERLSEIRARYPDEHPVSRFVSRRRAELLSLGLAEPRIS